MLVIKLIKSFITKTLVATVIGYAIGRFLLNDYMAVDQAISTAIMLTWNWMFIRMVWRGAKKLFTYAKRFIKLSAMQS